jgi:prevent-host-death family protein
MASVGAYEAKTHLARLLDRVAAGERITITRHGVAVAVLVPPERQERDLSEVIAEIREQRRGRRLEDRSVRELTDEGRASW